MFLRTTGLVSLVAHGSCYVVAPHGFCYFFSLFVNIISWLATLAIFVKGANIV